MVTAEVNSIVPVGEGCRASWVMAAVHPARLDVQAMGGEGQVMARSKCSQHCPESLRGSLGPDAEIALRTLDTTETCVGHSHTSAGFRIGVLREQTAGEKCRTSRRTRIAL